MVWAEILWVGAALFVALYFYLSATFGSFDQKRIPFRKPIPLLGNMGPLFFKKKSLAQLSQDFYLEFKSFGVGGVFEVRKPILVICDPEVVHAVCIKEYDCFLDHNLPVGEYIDGLFEKSLLALRGKRWNDVRTTLNPAFSEDAVKNMLSVVSECGQRTIDHLFEVTSKHSAGSKKALAVELRELFAHCVADVIAGAVFDAPSSIDFQQMGRQATAESGRKTAVTLGHLLFPGVMEMLGVNLLGAGVQRYFRELVRDTLVSRERRSSSETPTHMLQRLIQVRRRQLAEVAATAAAAEAADDTSGDEKGATEGDHNREGGPPAITPFSDDDITAQLMMFFLAGFDTVSTLLCFLTHLLAVHPDVQEKVHKEIEKTIQGSDKLTYDMLQSMTYLDMVISETLRMYPPNPVIGRTCTRTAAIKGTSRRSGFVMRPGDALWIPVYALHNDPDFFPEPDKFDPERFSEKNKEKIVPYSYIPFGAGPRSCIGMHFAVMEVKMIMVHLLSGFNVKAIDKTSNPPKLSKDSCLMDVVGGFWVGFDPKENGRRIRV